MGWTGWTGFSTPWKVFLEIFHAMETFFPRCGKWGARGGGHGGLGGDGFAHLAVHVGVDHHGDELLEGDVGGPAELVAGFGGVAEEEFDFGGADEGGVNDDVVFVVEADVGEGDLEEVAHGVGASGGDDVVVGGFLLEHEPHGADVVAGEAPVALGVEVAHAQLFLVAEFDAGDGVGDFAGDEFFAAAWGFVVEEDAGEGEEVVAFAVVDGDEVAVNFGDAVGAAGVEGGGLGLGGLDDFAEHFGGGGLVEFGVGGDHAHGFEELGDAEGGEFAGEDGLGPGGGHEAHGGEVVDFVGLDVFEDFDEGELVEEVGLEQVDLVFEVADALEGFGAGAADHAGDLVAFGEQPFGEIGAVLSGDAGDERFFHVLSPGLVGLVGVNFHSWFKCWTACRM